MRWRILPALFDQDQPLFDQDHLPEWYPGMTNDWPWSFVHTKLPPGTFEVHDGLGATRLLRFAEIDGWDGNRVVMKGEGEALDG
jgi:hypothetical protein